MRDAVQEIPQFECNKLHVEKHIGRGSFGEVFLTEFRNTDKEPVEKVVVNRMLEMQDEEDTKRFIKEVGIMNELNPLTFLFLWAILGFLVVTDIDRITRNWKHAKLILLFKST